VGVNVTLSVQDAPGSSVLRDYHKIKFTIFGDRSMLAL